jgi:hypothetical protein
VNFWRRVVLEQPRRGARFSWNERARYPRTAQKGGMMIASDAHDVRFTHTTEERDDDAPRDDWSRNVIRWIPFLPFVAAALIGFLFAIAAEA